MRDALKHRGPDDDGIWTDGSCGLVHTRLAVLDLSSRARQPMHSRSGRFCVSYNGEIYNYRELRRELLREGAAFKTTSDTEVILELAEFGGLKALAQLEGMFAFALYDREQRRLLLMRDRLGIKPLFYRRCEFGLAFASEPKALPGENRGVNPGAARLAEYIAFRHLAGEESLLPEVETLLPGHTLTSDGQAWKVAAWWTPQRYPLVAGNEEAASHVRAAVSRQLVSDVPVGIFLSGGIDSALVAAAAVAAEGPIETFTVGFSETGWDESNRARVVSDALGVRAHRLTLSPEEYVRELGRTLWHLDAPLNHAHSVHLLALSRLARKHVTVVLTGEGGDELFAGYPRYRLFLLSRALRRCPPRALTAAARRVRGSRPRLARLLEAAAVDSATAAAINAAFVPLTEAASLAGLDDPAQALLRRCARAREAERLGADPVQSLLALERETYLVSLLQRMDRMSMASGLECRVPLLDEEVLEYALCLPARECIDWRETKKPLRRAAARRFGRAYAHAPKSGFGVPLDAWFRGDGALSTWLSRMLCDRRTRERGWFDVDLAQRCFLEHRAGVRDRTEVLWGLLNLELFARVCLDGDAPEMVLQA